MVNITFTITPMSAPGSAALLTLFRLSGTHRCCPTWGSVFILVIRRGVCANAAMYFKAISPMTHPHRFLVSLHIHNTTYSFRISPCPLCSLLWISGLWHSTEIDSLSVVGFIRRLLRLLIIIRPDTPISWQVNNWCVFLGLFVPCFFLGISWQLDPPLALCFQMLLRRLWSQPGKQRKLFKEKRKSYFLRLVLPPTRVAFCMCSCNSKDCKWESILLFYYLILYFN